ncbi:hypothetical protein [Sphingomonas endophytica]|uniref:Uncharacterized protein n=1 Tax=Sphingomonas endophytica TaxID=869719 RepID=A0A147I3L3_9SPHN|nr:hypothetical protein [Sphingomonas endophytica]KTT72642.1 hypothetical protein NS334_08600 [Sphingomonas endophytica]
MSGVQKDLSMKLQRDLAEVLQRNLQLFQIALDPADMGAMLLEASLMIVASSAATMANLVAQRSTEADAIRIFNHMYDGTLSQLSDAKAVALARTLAELRARERGG